MAMLSTVLSRLFTVVSINVMLLVPGPSRRPKGDRRVPCPVRAKWAFLRQPIIAIGRCPNSLYVVWATVRLRFCSLGRSVRKVPSQCPTNGQLSVY